MPDDNPELKAAESRAADRLIFFSDAVVAIAITLLALDLPVPEGSTLSLFWKSVRHNGGHYFAFLISFFVIAAAWSNHHDVFRYTTRVDARLRQQNMAWLFTIVLIPFATKLLTTSGSAAAFRFGFYALMQLLSAAALLTMLKQMRASGLAPGAPAGVFSDMIWQSYGVMIAFGVSIPVFFVTSYGWVLWIIAPMVLGRIRGRGRGHGHSPRDPLVG